LSSTSRHPDILVSTQQGPPVASLGWALRRAAFGLLVLLVAVMLGAWLLYASIDPDEAVAGTPVPAVTAAPAR
jgi:hypothetical protein